MLERPWGIAVIGTATVRAEPDLARISFRVTRTEQGPAAAFDVTRAAVRAVRQALRDRGIDDDAVGASQLGLLTVSNNYGGIAGYQCQAAFSVEATQLDGVEALLVDLVAAGADQIDGVGFDVAARADLQVEARRRAIADARVNAELFADAAGVRLGAVLHIEEADPGRLHTREYAAMAAADASGRDLAPGHLTISAAVTVGYAITRD